MNMGSKEKNTPGNFNEKDTNTIIKSQSGVNYGYSSKQGGVRAGFNKAFKTAKSKGFDSFSFGYDKNKDNKISGNEVMKYTTKLKGEK